MLVLFVPLPHTDGFLEGEERRCAIASGQVDAQVLCEGGCECVVSRSGQPSPLRGRNGSGEGNPLSPVIHLRCQVQVKRASKMRRVNLT